MVAWAVLLWIFLSSWLPIRRVSQEVFVAQHVASAIIFTIFLWVHVPKHHRHPLVARIALFAWGATSRFAQLIGGNVHLGRRQSPCARGLRFGYLADLRVVDKNLTCMTIHNWQFDSKPGSHLCIWVLKSGLWMQSGHPFTVIPGTLSPVDDGDENRGCQSIQVMVDTKGGFTSILSGIAHSTRSLHIVTTPPLSGYHELHHFENLVLVSGSTGASFIISTREDLIKSSRLSQTQNLRALMLFRRPAHAGEYRDRLKGNIPISFATSCDVRIELAVVDKGDTTNALGRRSRPFKKLDHSEGSLEETELFTIEEADDMPTLDGELEEGLRDELQDISEEQEGPCLSRIVVLRSKRRPNTPSFLKGAMEAPPPGQTGIVVCGGHSLVRSVRTAVAQLNFQREWNGYDGQNAERHIELLVEELRIYNTWSTPSTNSFSQLFKSREEES